MANRMSAHIEEIIDKKNRAGPIRYITAGKDASLKKITKIQPLKRNPQDYDIIILGNPVWAWTITPALRIYIKENKDILKNKSISFFCTMGGSGSKRSFAVMQKLIGKKPRATLTLLTKEVWNNQFEDKAREFLRKI